MRFSGHYLCQAFGGNGNGGAAVVGISLVPGSPSRSRRPIRSQQSRGCFSSVVVVFPRVRGVIWVIFQIGLSCQSLC